MKRLVVAATVLVSALVGVAVAASPASASGSCGAPIVTSLPARADSGNHGNWAQDSITRTVTFCEAAAGGYHATVVDDGTFTTVAGSSPQAGVALAAGVTGTVHGSFTADFTTNPAVIDLSKLTGPDPSTTTSTWVQTIVGAEWAAGSSINNDWSWAYKSCSEQWVDSASNGDGSVPADGDITGAACPSPSPSPSPTPSPTHAAAPVTGPTPTHGTTPASRPQPVQAGPVPAVVTSQSPSAEAAPSDSPSTSPSAPSSAEATVSPAANAPATVATSNNSNLPWYIGGGGVVLIVGGPLLVLVARRRKHKFPEHYASTPTAEMRRVNDGPKP